MAVCGSITSWTSNSLFFGTIPCDYFCIWRFSGNATNNTAVYPTFSSIINLDAPSLTVMSNGPVFYIGGNITNTVEPTTLYSRLFILTSI